MAYSISVEQVAASLGGARPAGDGSWYCRCPSHDDGKPSLWIKERSGGGLHLKCHAGCAYDNVVAALQQRGLWPEPGARQRPKSDGEKRQRKGHDIAEVLRYAPADAPELDWARFRKPAPTRLYTYRDADGRLTGHVARWDDLTGGKEIRPISLARLVDGGLEWVMKAPPSPYGLYNLPDLIARPEAPVLVVEGEKAADAAKIKFPDHVAVTWRMGAKAVDKTDFGPLRGRSVVLWPDADEAGAAAMNAVHASLRDVQCVKVATVKLPLELPKGWDVADPLPAELSTEEILATASAADSDAEPPDAQPAVDTTKTGALLPFVVTAADLHLEEVDQREPIIDPFLLTSSLNMLFAPRGVGKTFLSLAIAISIAEGSAFLSYTVERPRRTLYVDGEMPLSDLKSRVVLMAPNPPSNFEIIPSERLFREGVPINLHSGEDQDRIFSLLRDLEELGRRPDVIIFDNLSSLSGGVNENDNSELDNLLRFLMALRHRGFAVLLVHHAGKGGDQRGASRREDLLDTVMALARPDDTETPKEGAHAILKFTKVRGRRPVPDELEIWLMDHDGRLEWAYQRPKSKNPAMAALRAIFEHRPDQQKDLCAILDVTAGRVSQILKKLRGADLVESDTLVLTHEGRERLLAEFPELYEVVAKQGHLFRDDGIV